MRVAYYGLVEGNCEWGKERNGKEYGRKMEGYVIKWGIWRKQESVWREGKLGISGNEEKWETEGKARKMRILVKLWWWKEEKDEKKNEPGGRRARGWPKEMELSKVKRLGICEGASHYYCYFVYVVRQTCSVSVSRVCGEKLPEMDKQNGKITGKKWRRKCTEGGWKRKAIKE